MLLFITRLLKGLVILFGISIPLEILGWIVLLIPCLLQDPKFLAPLPKILRWFDNADQFVGRNTEKYMAVYASGRWNRYVWLAFRNPCNYFGYKVLGVLVNNILLQNSIIGDINVGDSVGCVAGYMHQEVMIDDKNYYEYYYIYKYTLFGKPKCFRFRLGWKFGAIRTDVLGSIVESVCVIQPCINYTGL